jgi:fido (protein-threonine AMPylation protein)
MQAKDLKRLARLKRLAVSDLQTLARSLDLSPEFRTTVGFTGPSLQTAETVYVLPQFIAAELKPLLAHWNLLSNHNEVVLWLYRFTRVHPFADGNGRIGRMLAAAALVRSGFEMARAQRFLALLYLSLDYRQAMIAAFRTAEDYQDFAPLSALAESAWLESAS